MTTMMPMILAMEDPLQEVLPHTLFHLGPIPVTNHMIMASIAALLMLLIFPTLFSRPVSDAPKGARNFFESILEFLRVEVFRPALKEHTDRFVPFLWSMFFFILFCNLLGAIPLAAFFNLITRGKIEYLGGAATGNISTTLGLAICAFFFIHINGISQIVRDLMNGTYGHHGHHEEHSSGGGKGHEAAQDLPHMRGEALVADVPNNFDALGNPTKHYADDEYRKAHGHHAESHEAHGQAVAFPVALLMAIPLYFWNFAPHPFKPGPGESPMKWVADVLMWGILLVLELIGAVIKPVALCLRLFGNMVAGHVLLAVLIGLISAIPLLWLQFAVGVPVGILDICIQLLEIFVAFLQAYIFTFLTTLFIASAVAPEH